MLTIETQVLVEYKDFVTGAFNAFLPLFATIAGIFLAFAIANSARFLIQKMVGRKG
jgi:hypothetical protein